MPKSKYAFLMLLLAIAFSAAFAQQQRIAILNTEDDGDPQLEFTELSQPSKNSSSGNTFTDSRDDKTYKVVKIGSQTWIAENLNYNASGSKCYDNESENCDKYGKLYNWETAKKVCPAGWHLPSDAEWAALENAVGGFSVAGIALKSKSGWNNNGNGMDKYGFSVLPGGIGDSGGDFDGASYYAYFWSATESSASYARGKRLDYSYETMGRLNNFKTDMYSVRCVRD